MFQHSRGGRSFCKGVLYLKGQELVSVWNQKIGRKVTSDGVIQCPLLWLLAYFCCNFMNGSPGRITQGQPVFSNQIWKFLQWSSLDHLTSDFHKGGEIKSQPNQLSAHIVNFRSKQIVSVFMLKNWNYQTSWSFNNKKKIKIKSWSPENEQTQGWIKK